jgi:hypothetical protein
MGCSLVRMFHGRRPIVLPAAHSLKGSHMAEDGRNEGGAAWPLVEFYFDIDLGTGRAPRFYEVSGLYNEVARIEYRHTDGRIAPRAVAGRRIVLPAIILRKDPR